MRVKAWVDTPTNIGEAVGERSPPENCSKSRGSDGALGFGSAREAGPAAKGRRELGVCRLQGDRAHLGQHQPRNLHLHAVCRRPQVSEPSISSVDLSAGIIKLLPWGHEEGRRSSSLDAQVSVH